MCQKYKAKYNLKGGHKLKIIAMKDLLGSRFIVVESEDEKYYYEGKTRYSKDKMVELPSKCSKYVDYRTTFIRLEQTITGKDGIEYAIAFIETGIFAIIPMSELEDIEEEKNVLSKEELLKEEFNLESFEEFEEVVGIAKLLTFSKEDEDWDTSDNIERFFTGQKRKQLELAVAYRSAIIAKGRDVKEATEELKTLTEKLL